MGLTVTEQKWLTPRILDSKGRRPFLLSGTAYSARNAIAGHKGLHRERSPHLERAEAQDHLLARADDLHITPVSDLRHKLYGSFEIRAYIAANGSAEAESS